MTKGKRAGTTVFMRKNPPSNLMSDCTDKNFHKLPNWIKEPLVKNCKITHDECCEIKCPRGLKITEHRTIPAAKDGE